MSLLNPPQSIGAAIATAGLTFGIYAISLPDLARIHATDAHDPNVDTARKKAAVTAGLAALAIATLARDANPWILGGGAIVVSDWFVRHANATHPDTGKMVSTEGYQDTGSGAYGQAYGG
jgi:hypothetical protein